MTNKEYFSKNNKTVKEMMSDFSSSGFDSFDKWLDCKRNMFSNDITFITGDGNEITADEAMLSDDYIKYVCIKNSVLKKNDACFCVRLKDLDKDKTRMKTAKWSISEEFIKDIPVMEDGVISGYDVTSYVRLNCNSKEFPAFFVSDDSDHGPSFLPSIFQLNYLWKHKDDISTVMRKHGYENPFSFERNYFWSSTQYNAYGSWYWYSGGYWGNGLYKTHSFYVLPFFAIR